MANRVVSTRYPPLNLTVPPSTAIAAPVSFSPNLGDVMLLSIHLQIPPGHAGLTGIRFDSSGQTIVPWSQPSAWIIGDDTTPDFVVEVEVGNDFKVWAYNTDLIAHTFYGWFKVTDLQPGMNTPTQLVPIG